MKNIDACFSKNTDDWQTPKNLKEFLINECGCIDTFKFKSSYNELDNDYYNNKLFINPPYSKMKKVTEWIIKQIKNNNEIYLLIPSRTDTIYFHKLLEYQPEITFIKGRLHFNESKRPAPFPSILMYFSNEYRFKRYKSISSYALENI